MTTPHQQQLIAKAQSGAFGAGAQSVANKQQAPQPVQKPVSTVSYDVEAANRAAKALGFPAMTEVPTSAIKPINQPNIPEPVSQSVQETFFTGALQNLQNQRQGYEQELATRKADMDTKIAELQTREQEILKQAQPLTEPFREEKEKTERERLQVEENFFANQRLTNELDTLLTQGNALIAQRRGLPMHQRAQALRVNRSIEEVSARTGVIQAVMQARNNQIAQAYTLIDRSVEAIQADRRDSLNYYETLLSLNNQKLLSLDSESKKIANEQLNLIRSDFEKAQENVDHIKNLMQDPQTAQFMADAGVTLMDSPDQVSKKMADQARRQEAQDMRNKLVAQGYEILPYAASDSFPIEVGGQTMHARVRPGSELALDLEAKNAQIVASRALANQRSTVSGGVAGGGVDGSYQATGLSETEIGRLNEIGLSPAQQELVSAILRGDSPPIPPNNPRTKDIQMVLAGLGALGFDNTKAVQDWTSMQKRLQSMNSTQQVRLFQAVGAMEGSIEQADRLYKEWQATGLTSGFSTFNRAALAASANLPGEKGAVARTLLSHIEDMSAELATIYRGGNSPTDAAFAAAQKSLSADWNPETFEKNLELIRQNLRIRKNTMASATQVIGNQYAPESVNIEDVFNDAPHLQQQQQTLGVFDEVIGTGTQTQNSGYFSNLWGSTKSFIGSIFGQ